MSKEAGKKIIEARNRLGLTQAAMADRLAQALHQTYSQRQYQKLEEGNFPKHKKIIVETLDSILDTNIFRLVYEDIVPHETSKTAQEHSIRKPKIDANHEEEGIIFVDIRAQAGYSKKFMDPLFTNSLQKLFIPGLPYRGEKFRVFEVEGNSMEPTFKEHMHVLTEKVDQDQWNNVKDFYTYVIVAEDGIMIKRVFKKDADTWILVSDNEDLYPQFIQPVSGVKELWFVKRRLDWEMAPPKKFQIKL